MTTATRNRPITPEDVRAHSNTRVRLVAIEDERLGIDTVIVGDVLTVARRLDGKRTYEAIIVDVLGEGHAVSLRRIRSIDVWAPQSPPVFVVTSDPAATSAAARHALIGGHLNAVCRECGSALSGRRSHLESRGWACDVEAT